LQISTGTLESTSLELQDFLKVQQNYEMPLLFHLFIAEPGERAGKSPWKLFGETLTGTEEIHTDSTSKYLN
jgi:hypothetical protein